VAEILKSLTIKDVDGRSQLMMIPKAYVDAHPPDWLAEFGELGQHTLRLTLVDPESRERTKRYTITNAHGARHVGIPRLWLQDRSARDGDVLDLIDDDGELFVRLTKKGRGPT
jgi:hypothetical protein